MQGLSIAVPSHVLVQCPHAITRVEPAADGVPRFQTVLLLHIVASSSYTGTCSLGSLCIVAPRGGRPCCSIPIRLKVLLKGWCFSMVLHEPQICVCWSLHLHAAAAIPWLWTPNLRSSFQIKMLDGHQ
jgi:hypothetical protein